jgi:HTH-type transcriptional regulator / antitoxin HigA
MDVKPIKTKRDYEATLKEIESLMEVKRGSQDGDRLDVLVTLVEAYEARHFPLDLPDPVAAIRFVMEQRGRPLTMAMAWKLHQGLGIPAESLIRQSP